MREGKLAGGQKRWRDREPREREPLLWTQSHTEDEQGMCSGRENDGMKASRGRGKGRDGRPDDLKRHLAC